MSKFMASTNTFRSYMFQAHRKGQPVHSAAKIKVMNVFYKLKEIEPRKTNRELINITSELTGVSPASINRMNREFREKGMLSTLGQTSSKRAGKSTKCAKPCKTKTAKSRTVDKDSGNLAREIKKKKEYYESKKAEKILGHRKKWGKTFILVKWEGNVTPEYVEKEYVSKEILNLYQAYMEEELRELDCNVITNERFVIEREPSSLISDYGWRQIKVAQEISDSHPEADYHLDIEVE